LTPSGAPSPGSVNISWEQTPHQGTERLLPVAFQQ
jgi:hypothetical protein